MLRSVLSLDSGLACWEKTFLNVRVLETAPFCRQLNVIKELSEYNDHNSLTLPPKTISVFEQHIEK
jgi:hypothetical protein